MSVDDHADAQAPDAAGVMFTARIRQMQAARGSRADFAAREAAQGWPTEISADLASFIEATTTCYLATVSAAGQPYVQHRGGPPGFLRVIDPRTIAFADYRGNRQFITTGNLADNDRVHLFLMDYQNRRRVKLWGRARIETDPAMARRLFPEGYRAAIEQAIVITVAAWDINCNQHIPQMFHAADVAHTIQTMQARIRELDAELAALKAQSSA